MLNLSSRSEMSLDFIENKVQFHLHRLTTEQRHPKTANLSQVYNLNSSFSTLKGDTSSRPF